LIGSQIYWAVDKSRSLFLSYKVHDPDPQSELLEREVRCSTCPAQQLPGRQAAAAEAQISSCTDCLHALASLRPLVDRFISSPSEFLRPTKSLQMRLARRISEELREPLVPPPISRWSEPDWEQVATGIECQLLATDTERHRVSMLVCFAPGASYPPHTYAHVEELYLLDGTLWIDDHKLLPGDYYNYGALGTSDKMVWTETGCICVLITSANDSLV
jgi:hypothetical protein